MPRKVPAVFPGANRLFVDLPPGATRLGHLPSGATRLGHLPSWANVLTPYWPGGPPQSDLNNLLAGYADGDEASRRPGQD